MERSLVRYRNIVMDSVRWEGFSFREGDIIISTPPKCGTTWTQAICALLIFQTTDFPQAVDQISPWLDQSLRPLDEVVADLEAQEHRRFIKSHTPLDGLPWDENVTYICVGRDPRDVALSWDNHMSNINLQRFLELRAAAVGTDDLAEVMPEPPPPPLETESGRFWQWVDEPVGVGGTTSIGGLAGTLNHLSSFWKARHEPNVVMVHYGDLKADLEGEMRKLADRLRIEVPDSLWPDLVKAATFEDMKRRAADRAPNATEPIWNDTDRFFNRGTVGQWCHLLDDEDLKRYAAKAAELGDHGLLEWAHQGPPDARPG